MKNPTLKKILKKAKKSARLTRQADRVACDAVLTLERYLGLSKGDLDSDAGLFLDMLAGYGKCGKETLNIAIEEIKKEKKIV